jgi:hypothetical protein
VKDAPAGRDPVIYSKESPSGSDPETVKASVDPSFTVFDPIGVRTGSRFTLFTVMVIVSLALREPSETERVAWYVPAWL